MSKIQDALRRMQNAHQKQTGRDMPAYSNVQKLARVSRSVEIADVRTTKAGGKNGGNDGTSAKHFARIDREALQSAGLIAPDQGERILADEYRKIKRPLVANAFGKRAAKVESGRLILVASALPKDGKTFTCINLALSLAQEQDLSVVLVDADVAKPHISKLFGLEACLGLLDLIENRDLLLSDVLVDTDVERLTLLPSGKSRAQATELLASDRMDQIVGMLVDEDLNRIVVFDSPPMLATNEANVLAGIAGQIVLVVKAGITPQHAVEDAVALMDPGKSINLILNEAKKGTNFENWGRYYGYGSDYARYPDKTPEGEPQP